MIDSLVRRALPLALCLAAACATPPRAGLPKIELPPGALAAARTAEPEPESAGDAPGAHWSLADPVAPRWPEPFWTDDDGEGDPWRADAVDEIASSDGWIHVFNLHTGGRSFDDAALGDIDDQVVAGVGWATYHPDRFFGFEVSAFGSAFDDEVFLDLFDDEGELDSTTVEIAAGVRHVFGSRASRFHPYVAVGGSVLIFEIDIDEDLDLEEEQDVLFGLYFHFGASYRITEHLLLGLDARTLAPESAEIDGTRFDAEYSQVTVFLGGSI